MIGKTIGPYNITGVLGKGGMGIVYKAIHTTLEQQVAIKALSSDMSDNPSNRQRFIKEAKIHAKFSHPNVVNIFNYLEEENDVFIVMEYVDGETLDQKLKREGTISEEQAISLSLPVLQALDFMHSNGVVHRDIKPSNIMITKTGLVKVTDFGIAKIVNEKTQQTKTGMVGSLYYISPEQILGEQTSAATDVYSFGATLFHMVTGKALYEGTEYAIMRSHLEGKPIPPWELNDSVSKNFGKVVLKAIQKAPRDRYKSAKEFSSDLIKVQSGSQISISLPGILKNNKNRLTEVVSKRKRAIYGGIAAVLLFTVIAFGINRDPQQQNVNPVNTSSVIDKGSKEQLLPNTEIDTVTDINQTKSVPKSLTSTNIKPSQRKPIKTQKQFEEDERFILFDEELYKEKNTRKSAEQNKKLEEKNRILEDKLREEQKRYEAKAREKRKREQRLKREEEKKLREQEKKQNGGVKNSYKKVYNPVKKNVFHPIKKGFNKLKDKID
ncbi:MAG TPA: protein kinase [Thermodesulfobacteriota bacterium]|nr:protein kinase [Thermodesulfobacteriota bacterium]